MSDAATPTSGTKIKGWTDIEKAGLLFQIIAKMDKPIPWKELELPEGRTLKAVQVMIDKEKSKLRKAGEIGGTPSKADKKRAAAEDDEEGGAKKSKAGRKKKVSAGEDDDDESGIKAEMEDDLLR